MYIYNTPAMQSPPSLALPHLAPPHLAVRVATAKLHC